MPELMLVAEGRGSGEAAEASRVFFGCTYIYWEPCLIFWLGGASQILFAVHTCFFWFGLVWETDCCFLDAKRSSKALKTFYSRFLFELNFCL